MNPKASTHKPDGSTRLEAASDVSRRWAGAMATKKLRGERLTTPPTVTTLLSALGLGEVKVSGFRTNSLAFNFACRLLWGPCIRNTSMAVCVREPVCNHTLR